MKVIINCLSAIKSKTGIGHHVTNLHSSLVEQFPNDRFDRYPGEWLFRRKIQPKAVPSQGQKKRTSVGHWPRSIAKELTPAHFYAYTQAYHYDLYHEPNFIAFRTQLPVVLTIHDLSVWKYPQWHPEDRVRVHRLYFESSIKRADQIIVVSNTIREELLMHFAINSSKMSVIHNGVDSDYFQSTTDASEILRERYSLPDRYFLCVGTVEPRKNLLTVMRAMSQLPVTIAKDCPLILVGPWGWRSETERAFYDSKRDLGIIRHLGYIDDTDMSAIYHSAHALLYPSHYEGFGLPMIEMMANGGKVIASDIPVHREVAGGFATLIPRMMLMLGLMQ